MFFFPCPLILSIRNNFAKILHNPNISFHLISTNLTLFCTFFLFQKSEFKGHDFVDAKKPILKYEVGYMKFLVLYIYIYIYYLLSLNETLFSFNIVMIKSKNQWNKLYLRFLLRKKERLISDLNLNFVNLSRTIQWSRS